MTMFERFTKAARQIVLDAVVEAEHERAERVTPEHLLLALLREGTSSAPILTKAGLTRDVIRTELAAANRRGGLTEAQAQALRELGIDLNAVVDRVEATHGENALAAPRRRPRPPKTHIPFSPEAKSVLANTLVQARELGHRQITDEHFLLAIAASPHLASDLLTTHGLP